MNQTLSEVDVQEVVECISDLDSHKAVGIDRIPTKFIKSSPVCMAMLLTRLGNKSILSATFPDCCTVPKSHTGSSLINFHLISMLPVFSKILERAVSDQIIAHSNGQFVLTKTI